MEKQDTLNSTVDSNHEAKTSHTDPIKFNKDFYYAQRVPTFVCNSVSGLSEISRWVLNINQVLFIEKRHAPGLCVKKLSKLTRHDGLESNPVLVRPDSLIYTSESIIQYYDQKNPAEKRLFPTGDNQETVERLYKRYVNDLNPYVWQYLYSELLPSKKDGKKLLKKDAPFWERVKISLSYSSVKRQLNEQWKIEGKDPVVFLVEIQKIFGEVSELLKGEGRYLTGDRLTAADLAFASVAAPLIIPEEYGGSIYKFNEIPEELRQEIIALRATPAGQWILGIYQEERVINLDLGETPKKPGAFKRMLSRLMIKLTSNQGKLFYRLQKSFPVIKLGIFKLAVISRHDLVVDVLKRNGDFTIKEINAKKMANQKGAFFLGMDKNNPQFDRERDFVRKSAKTTDLELIREYIREKSAVITDQVQPFEKLDVVQTLNYSVLTGIIDHYFGVPAPVNAQLERWQRTMFYDLFLNFTGNEKKHQLAVNSGKERTAWVRSLITERKEARKRGENLEDNLLNRLIILQESNTWADDDTLRRNIGGLLTGLQETTSKAVIFALEELFKRPEQLKGAIAAAKAEDMEAMKGYVYEALRFNPVQPGVLRFSETKQFIKGANGKTYKINGNRKLMTLTSGAMFDPVTFPDPKTFNPKRDARYMNWGFGLHECYGKYINSVTIPELVAAVLRLKNVRLAKGSIGRGAGLKDGPFPNNYVVEFDS